MSVYTYVLMREGVIIQNIQQKLLDFTIQYSEGIATREEIENAQESSLVDIITETLNVFKEELLTEIKLLIKSEVEEVLKK